MAKWVKLTKDLKDRNWKKGERKKVRNSKAKELIANNQAVEVKANQKKLKIKDLKDEEDKSLPAHK